MKDVDLIKEVYVNFLGYFLCLFCVVYWKVCLQSCDQWGVAAEGGMQECILSEAEQAGQKILQKKEKTLTTDVYMSLC